MFAESHPLIRRFIRFLALPYCYFGRRNLQDCKTPRFQVIRDLLFIFFRFKYYPDNYFPCRLWEKDRKDWVKYYGSSYNSYPRYRLRKEVQKLEYRILFQDKEVCDLVCRGMEITIPKTFGVISTSSTAKEKLKNILLDSKYKKIICKPLFGFAGKGIFLANRKDNDINIITNDKKTLDIEELVVNESFVMQEMVEQNSVVAEIFSNSVNTIRIITLYNKSDDVVIVGSTMRFGCGDNFVDNWSAGGVAVGVDHHAGTLKKYAYDKYGKKYTKHPDTGVTFSGFEIPIWEEVMQTAITVQKDCPFYRMLGMDIAITETGPVIIEINGEPDLVFIEQTSGPLLADKLVLQSFKEYNLLINEFQQQL